MYVYMYIYTLYELICFTETTNSMIYETIDYKNDIHLRLSFKKCLSF